MARNHSNVAVIVGGRGTGKTTKAQKIIEGSKKPKILVVDTFHHPSYSNWEVMEPEKLALWKSGKYHLHDSDTDYLLALIEQDVNNALIIFEDSAKYVNQNPQREVKKICLDSKQRNNDVVFIYHSFAEIPKSFLRWIDYITIFKTQEVIESQKNRLFGYDKIYPVWTEVSKSPDKYKNITIQLL